MKKVIIYIVFIDSEGKETFEVEFKGFITRRYIYAKTNSKSEHLPCIYVKVARKDTICIKDQTKVMYRRLEVSELEGLEDPRIKTDFEFPEKVIEAIELANKEKNKQ